MDSEKEESPARMTVKQKVELWATWCVGNYYVAWQLSGTLLPFLGSGFPYKNEQPRNEGLGFRVYRFRA